ncbi:DNA repair protein RecO [Flavobacteriales bacterium]|nr:DNA repair protein RecO [Flavobacteriales bacterium]
MKYSSRAIALTYLKHSESSIIAKLFTEEHGLQTFIVNGVRSNKSKKKLGLFQPLQLSQINASLLIKNKMQYLNEISLADNKLSESISIKNNFIALFIAEVLSKSLCENGKDKKLFQYIWDIKISLTITSKINENYPLLFLLKLTDFLGFYPSKDSLLYNYFDLEKGEFVINKGTYTLTVENSNYLKYLLTEISCVIPYQNRNDLLKSLIEYYKLQHHELKNITSHLIIESLKT